VKLIIQPDDGLAPVLKAVRQAKKTIDIVIFRFDRTELEEALEAAVARNVVVRALIAHTNRGGEKTLRKLEMRLLKSGVSVARTADDLPRYHGKMMVVDGALYVFGFNYTKLDIIKSRSFGVMTRDKKLVKEAAALFEADTCRQPYVPSHPRLVVSPETSRVRLSAHQGGRKRPRHRAAGEDDRGHRDATAGGAAPPRPRDGPRRVGRVYRKSEPSQARARRAARGGHHRSGCEDRATNPIGVRV